MLSQDRVDRESADGHNRAAGIGKDPAGFGGDKDTPGIGVLRLQIQGNLKTGNTRRGDLPGINTQGGIAYPRFAAFFLGENGKITPIPGNKSSGGIRRVIRIISGILPLHPDCLAGLVAEPEFIIIEKLTGHIKAGIIEYATVRRQQVNTGDRRRGVAVVYIQSPTPQGVDDRLRNDAPDGIGKIVAVVAVPAAFFAGIEQA